jgi:hypothetical protein
MKRQAFLFSVAVAALTMILSACGEGPKSRSGSTPPILCTPGAPGCVPGGIPGGSYYGKTWTGSLRISAASTYRLFLKDFFVCDRYAVSFGTEECEAWDNQGSIQLEVFGNQLPAQGRVTVYAAMDGWGYEVRQATFSGIAQPINNNTGFEIRTTGGYTGYNNIFSAIGNVGNIVSGTQVVQQFRLTLTRDGTQYATADMTLRW